MPEFHVLFQASVKSGREDGSSPAGRLRHGVQKLFVPELAARQGITELDGETLENVLDAIVEGMEHGGQGGELDVIRRVRHTLVHERAVDFEQAAELVSLQCDLLLQPIPHAGVLPGS
jgi:hypothetical protein